jgi:hypothetical protein
VYACRYIIGSIRGLFCHFVVKLEMKDCLRVSIYQVTLHSVKRTTDALVAKSWVEDVAACLCLSCEVAKFHHLVAWLSDL